MNSGKRLAYVMSRFPHLPETFILREMVELERQGWPLELFPLVRQSQTVVHAEAQSWLERAQSQPFFSAPVLGSALRGFFHHPLKVSRLWAEMVWRNRSSLPFLARALALFPKSIWVAEQMQRQGVAHIHAHYATHPALMAWLVHRLNGTSYSFTAHAHDLYVQRTMLDQKVREAAFVVTISAYNRELIGQTLGPWAREKTHVIHCGILPQNYPPRPPLAPVEPFHILSIGSLQPYKGQKYLVDACAQLQRTGLDFICEIIGGGELREELQEQINQLGLGARVLLLGPLPQEEVARRLPRADCYVQPSIIMPSGKMEGIPVALMEAMACGVPVVATAISGVPELVRPAETGLLAPPADAAALAKAIQAVYEQPQAAEERRQAGRALVLAEFDLNKNVHQLSDLFLAALE